MKNVVGGETMKRYVGIFVVCLALVYSAKGSDQSTRVSVAVSVAVSGEKADSAAGVLTDLLTTRLPSDPQWSLVDRSALNALEQELTLSAGGWTDAASAVRHGRLVHADLVLVCRVRASGDDTGEAQLEVVDAFRAERLASATVALSGRPDGKWLRSPVEADLKSITSCSEQLIAKAVKRLGEVKGWPVVAPLFFRKTGSSDRVLPLAESILSHLAKDSEGRHIRVLMPHSEGASHAEGLLFNAGLTDFSANAWGHVADMYVWGEYSEDTSYGKLPAEVTVKAKVWTWDGSQPPRSTEFAGRLGDLNALAKTVADFVYSSTKVCPDPSPDARRVVAESLMAEAKKIGLLPIKNYYGYSGPKFDVLLRNQRLANVAQLVDAAAFFVPENFSIQEERLWLNFWRLHHQPTPDVALAENLAAQYRRLALNAWQQTSGEWDIGIIARCLDSYQSRNPDVLTMAAEVGSQLKQVDKDELGKTRQLSENIFKKVFGPFWQIDGSGSPELVRPLEAFWPVLRKVRADKLAPPNSGQLQSKRDGDDWRFWITRVYPSGSARAKALLNDEVPELRLPANTSSIRLIESAKPEDAFSENAAAVTAESLSVVAVPVFKQEDFEANKNPWLLDALPEIIPGIAAFAPAQLQKLPVKEPVFQVVLGATASDDSLWAICNDLGWESPGERLNLWKLDVIHQTVVRQNETLNVTQPISAIESVGQFLYAGTRGEGLRVLDLKSAQVQSITSKEGLYSDDVTQITAFGGKLIIQSGTPARPAVFQWRSDSNESVLCSDSLANELPLVPTAAVVLGEKLIFEKPALGSLPAGKSKLKPDENLPNRQTEVVNRIYPGFGAGLTAQKKQKNIQPITICPDKGGRGVWLVWGEILYRASQGRAEPKACWVGQKPTSLADDGRFLYVLVQPEEPVRDNSQPSIPEQSAVKPQLACARVFVLNLQDEKWVGWFGVPDRGILLSGTAGTLWLIRRHALPFVAIDTGAWNPRSVSTGAPIPAHDIFAQIAAHDIAGLKRSLETKQNANEATESGWTPLMAAAWWSDEEAVKLLLAAGANVESSDQRGWHPLRIAAEKGNQKIVRLLLGSGANIDFAAEAYPWTPKHFPVESGESYNSTVLRTDKRTALHGAAASGQSEMVALLLKAGANWKTFDGEGMTPLHLAVRFASAVTVNAFVAGGADLAIVDSKGVPAAEMTRNRSDLTELTTKVAQTPAMLTAQMESLLTGPDNLDEFRRLLAAGANPASGGEIKFPVIYQAAKWGKWNYVEAALEHSIDLSLPIRYGVDRPTTVGAVLFYEALAQDAPRIDIARKLLELGAKPDGEAYAWNKVSTLMLAWKSGDLEILSHLLDLGIVQFPTVHFDEQLLIKAVIAAKDEATLKLLMPYTQKLRPGSSSPMIYIEDVTGDGRTPLLAAVVARWNKGVEILVQAGADTEVKDTSGKSLQDYASGDAKIALALNVRRAQDENRPRGAEVVQAVVKNDPTIERWPIDDAVLKYRDFRNWTVLHHALYHKRLGLALRLVNAGMALDVLTRAGQSALTFAASTGNEEIVSAMLKAGAPVNLAGVDALTPLYQGVRSGNVRIVTLLLAARANPQRTVFEKKTTPILGAAGVTKSIPVIEALLAAGSSITDVDSNGLGILEYAVWSDDAGVIQYLVDKGAKWRESSSDPDYHPLVTAAKHGKKESVRKLLELGKRDPRALAVAGDPEIRAMLEDDAKTKGSRVVEDEELWPAICKDRENWKTRAEAHVAKGGNVNYRSREWTPLILALDEVNPAFVKWLLSNGANPKLFPINEAIGNDIYGELLGGWSRIRPNRSETMKDESLAEIVALLSGAGAGKPSAFPLSIAAENGWSKTAEKLIAAGAPVDEVAAEFQKPNYSTEEKRRAMKLLGL